MEISAIVILGSKNTSKFLTSSPCLNLWCFLSIFDRFRAIPASFSSTVVRYIVRVGVVIRSVELMITAFRFQLRLCRLQSAYDLVKTRLSESEAEAEELNQSQGVGKCIVTGLSFRFCFGLRQSGFH